MKEQVILARNGGRANDSDSWVLVQFSRHSRINWFQKAEC